MIGQNCRVLQKNLKHCGKYYKDTDKDTDRETLTYPSRVRTIDGRPKLVENFSFKYNYSYSCVQGFCILFSRKDVDQTVKYELTCNFERHLKFMWYLPGFNLSPVRKHKLPLQPCFQLCRRRGSVSLRH